MNQDKERFIKLLKQFVHEEALDMDDITSEEWKSIYSLSMIHSLNGVVAYMFTTSPYAALNTPIRASMKHTMMETIGVYSNRAEMMKVLIGNLNKAGIDHLLFKGFLVRDLYPMAEFRTFGDIDFLIRLEDRDKVHQLMLDKGFEVKTDWEPVYSYYKGLEYYEIHSHVMEVDVSDKADYVGYYNNIWDHAVLQDEDSGHMHTYVLDLEYHLLYLLTHIAKHISSSGAGIRMYLDIAFYLKRYKNDIDWVHFQGEVEKLKFESFVNMTFSAVETWFGVESPIPLSPVEPSVMEDFLDFTLDGGVFGHVGRSSGETWLKNDERNNGEEVSKFKTLLHRAFPSADTIKSRYTYLQKYPWLLPFAWVHRLMKTKESWGDHMQQARDIVNADDEKILKLRRVYKNIGL